MKKWYNNLTPKQLIFLYIISVVLIVPYGIGLVPLALLIYLKLGNS